MTILQFLKTHHVPATIINAGGRRCKRTWFQFPVKQCTMGGGHYAIWLQVHTSLKTAACAMMGKTVKGCTSGPRSSCGIAWLLVKEICKLRPKPWKYNSGYRMTRGAFQAGEQHMPRPWGRKQKTTQLERLQKERKKYNTELAMDTGPKLSVLGDCRK